MAARKKGLRIALLYPEQIYPGRLGSTRCLMDLSRALRLSGYSVRAFTLGEEDRHVLENGHDELVLGSRVSADRRSLGIKLFDYVALGATGSQRSYRIINRHVGLRLAVSEYAPDVIITVGRHMTDFMLSYRRAYGARCIAITDDFRVVENALRIRSDAARKRRDNPVKLVALSQANRLFLRFSWNVYSKMVNGFDDVVFLTSEDLQMASGRFPAMRHKFSCLPVAACDPAQLVRRPASRPSKKVETLLFIGNSRHEPNLEAMQLIEKRIAPFLPGKRFLILGSGTVPRRIGNVEYLGYLSEKDKLRMIDNADLCLAPLVNGSGIKIKMLDYFMRARPVLATSLALEGYPVKDGTHCVVENDVGRYPERILQLESSPLLRGKLGRNAAKACGAYFSYRNIGRSWNILLSNKRGVGRNRLSSDEFVANRRVILRKTKNAR